MTNKSIRTKGSKVKKIYLIKFSYGKYPYYKMKRLIESNSSINAWGKIQDIYEEPELISIQIVEEL